MQETTITTNDTKNGTTYTTKDKLYAAYGDYSSGYDGYITVGTNTAESLNGGLSIKLKGDSPYAEGDHFWLRPPFRSYDVSALFVVPGTYVGSKHVGSPNAVVPAFNLNLSSVLFASAAPAASSEEVLTLGEAMTLRYDAGTDLGSAAINPVQSSVSVSGAPAGTYLVVQKDSGAWAKAVSENMTISAKEMDTSLTSFEDCKVWLEKTDTGRITTAVMAVPGYETKITNPSGSHITRSTAAGNGAETQIAAPGTAITDVVYTVDSGYYFPENYKVAEVNGITVIRNSRTQITVSGAPTADAEITLTAATEQTHTITTDPAALNFGTVNLDDKGSYTQPETQTVTVTNSGNNTVTLTKPTSTGYVIGELSTAALGAGETATFTVQPKGDLVAGTYSETLEVKTNEGTKATVALSFTVKAKSGDAPKITKGADKPASGKTISSNNGTGTKVPQTGDNSHLFLWFILLALCGGTITVISIRKKKI